MKKIFPVICVFGIFAFFHVGLAQTPPPESTMDLKANGSDGPLTVPRYTDVLLSWTYSGPFSSNSTGASGGLCEASGSWSGRKTDIGQEFTGALTSNRVYTLTCRYPNDGGGRSFAVDTVTIFVTDSTPTPTPAPATDWNALLNQYSPDWDEQGYNWGSITDDNDVTRWYRKEGALWVQKSSEAAAQTPYSATTPAPILTATCDSTAKAIVTAAGGCSNIDPGVYKNVYAACCQIITKETLLQMLDDALADGVLDKAEKSSLLGALNTYLSQ